MADFLKDRVWRAARNELRSDQPLTTREIRERLDCSNLSDAEDAEKAVHRSLNRVLDEKKENGVVQQEKIDTRFTSRRENLWNLID